MNNRHVQTFLMVSAAFFAISAPLRSNAANPAVATRGTTARSAQIAPSKGCPECPQISTRHDDGKN